MARSRQSLIGRRYIELAPEEGDSALLLDCLFGDDAERCIHSVHALRAEVARLCTRDFASGNTVLLDGWILARTEARVCALAALS